MVMMLMMTTVIMFGTICRNGSCGKTVRWACGGCNWPAGKWSAASSRVIVGSSILFVSTGLSALVFNASRATLGLSHWHDPDNQL